MDSFKPFRRKAPQPKGALINAIRKLKPGECVILPSTAQTLCNVAGYLVRRGEFKRGELTTRAEPDGRGCIWRRDLA